MPEEKVERLNAGQIAPLAPPPLPPARKFGRSITAPAILGSGVGVARHDLQLYLAGNEITRLPTELFHLDKLTFLSLRTFPHLHSSNIDLNHGRRAEQA